MFNKVNYLNQISETFGVGKKKIRLICNKLGLNRVVKPKNLKKSQSKSVLNSTKQMILSKALKNQIKRVIDFSIKIKTYRGTRNKLKYPARGQRTKTNGKTKKKFKI